MTGAVSSLITTDSALRSATSALSRQMHPEGRHVEAEFETRSGGAVFKGATPAEVDAFTMDNLRQGTKRTRMDMATSEGFTLVATSIASNKGNALSDDIAIIRGDVDGVVKGTHQPRTAILGFAKMMDRMNANARLIQQGRQGAEQGIQDAVNTVNILIEELDTLNRLVGNANSGDRKTQLAELETQQNAAITKLMGLMNVQTQRSESGHVRITVGTQTLLDTRIHPVSFVARPQVNGSMTYENGQLNGLILDSVDITSLLNGGEIKGFFDLRDDKLPVQATRLDKLAHTTRFEMNKLFNSGSGYPPPTSLSGTHIYQADGSDTVDVIGDTYITITDRDGKFVARHQISNASTTLGAVIADINTTISPTYGTAVINADGTVSINCTGNYRVAIGGDGTIELDTDVSTRTNFSHFCGFNNVISMANNNPTGSSLIDAAPDLLGTIAGFAGGDTITIAGEIKIGIYDSRNEYATSYTLATGDTTLAAAIAAINTALSPASATATLSADGKLSIAGENGYRVTIGGAGTIQFTGDINTNSDFKTFFGFSGLHNTTSVAADVRVGDSYKNNPSLIPVSLVDTSVTTAGISAVSIGDNQVMAQMATLLGTNGVNVTIDEVSAPLAQQFVLFLGNLAQEAKSMKISAEQQQANLEHLETNYTNAVGVNIEQLYFVIQNFLIVEQAVVGTLHKILDSNANTIRVLTG